MKLLLLMLTFVPFTYGFESFPSNYNKNTPIFYVLHGCKQNATSILKDSFLLNKGKEKVIILAPNQNPMLNIQNCWNWFLATNTYPTPGHELYYLINRLRYFKKKYHLSQNPTYVMGISAGGAMSLNLMACFPEEFAGIATHSSPPYKITNNIFDVANILTDGPKKSSDQLAEHFISCSNKKSFKNKKFLFIHGKNDYRVVIDHLYALENQVLNAFDLQDDQSINHSFIKVPIIKKHTVKYQYEYERRSYQLPENSTIEVFEINKLGHDWSGGQYRVERNDPNGPDVTSFILKYFL